VTERTLKIGPGFWFAFAKVWKSPSEVPRIVQMLVWAGPKRFDPFDGKSIVMWNASDL
jgi:hypothetical protein